MSAFDAETVQLLWDVAGSADAHINRPLIVFLTAMWMSEDDARGLAVDLLSVFERLGRERPDVVLPFLGALLNDLEGGAA